MSKGHFIHMIETWNTQDNHNIVTIGKDVKRFMVLPVNNGQRDDKNMRVFLLDDNNERTHIGDYSTKDDNWQIKALNDAGIIDDGYLTDEQLSYFLNKRMFGKG